VKSFALCLESFITFFLIRSAELHAESACQKSLKSLMIRVTRFHVLASLAGVHLRKVLFMVNLRQPGCCANSAVSAVSGNHDYCVSVDCSAICARLRLGQYRSRRHLAIAAAFTETAVWPPWLAVLVMTLLLFLLFIIPIALLVNSLVDPAARLFAPSPAAT
jgi:hypothetical protein